MMERYGFDYDGFCEDPNGEYVAYKDHQAEVKRLREALTPFAEIEANSDQTDVACIISSIYIAQAKQALEEGV